MKKKYFMWLLFCFWMIACHTYAQQHQVEVYPQNWWTGMKLNRVELLLRASNSTFFDQPVRISYPGVTLNKIQKFANKKYLILDITIGADAQPGIVSIEVGAGKKKKVILWRLDKRRTGNGTEYAKGVTSADFMDLLIVDRFSNGDPSNDRVKGLKDQTLNRDSMYDRHGGDLQGVINHIDYFKNMGITALWLLPVMENDMAYRTEHGYAITNHYKIDPRLGGDAKYKELSAVLHANGMKLIMDAVYNHVGIFHFLEQDPPDSTWMHRWPVFTQTSYREQTIFDPYAAPSQTKKMTDGWFEPKMPDINHHNPFMANYLIQNMIWYIEEFGIDAVRIDTYTYSDRDFANRCNQAVMDEFPKLTLFGETRVFGVANQAYFNENNFNTSFKSNLQGSVDFQCLYYGIIPALTQPFGWTDGVSKMYYTLSSDFLNKDATRNVLLLDNHDEPRFFSVVGENVAKQKMGFQWLLTCRGIPQLYYGSEVLLTGFTNPDGHVRSDFPGGWTGDKKNAFTGEGLTANEKEVQDLVRKLANFRLNSSALKTGKLMHYIPEDGLYVYFRYDNNQTIMCIMNTSDKTKPLNFSAYPERTSGFSEAKDVVEGTGYKTNEGLFVPAMKMLVLELK